jgi:hypothetical protein
MAYEKRLFWAKILVSLALTAYVLLPPLVDFGDSHIASQHWTPHARLHLAWTLYGNILALPIMLWAIWSRRLFGTARSVRLMAYLGLAFTMGFFIAGAFSHKLGADYHDPGHERLIFGIDTNLVMNGTILILLFAGIFLSIRRSEPDQQEH